MTRLPRYPEESVAIPNIPDKAWNEPENGKAKNKPRGKIPLFNDKAAGRLRTDSDKIKEGTDPIFPCFCPRAGMQGRRELGKSRGRHGSDVSAVRNRVSGDRTTNFLEDFTDSERELHLLLSFALVVSSAERGSFLPGDGKILIPKIRVLNPQQRGFKDTGFPWIILDYSWIILMEFLPPPLPVFPCVSAPLPPAKLRKAPDRVICYNSTRNVAVPVGFLIEIP